jgi:hypothetical protein
MIDTSMITVDALNADPYPVYDELRKIAPIVYVPQIDEWLVTSWNDCRAIGALKDSVQLAPGHPVDQEFFGGDSVLTMSGEKHRGLREGIDQSLKAGPVARFLDDGGRDTVIRYIDAIAPQAHEPGGSIVAIGPAVMMVLRLGCPGAEIRLGSMPRPVAMSPVQATLTVRTIPSLGEFGGRRTTSRTTLETSVDTSRGCDVCIGSSAP